MSNSPGAITEKKRGVLFVISAPSGAGKTSLVKSLIETLPGLHVSISHTTRQGRPYEKDGIDYHFVGQTKFLSMVATGQFLEHAQVFDHHYGTSRAWVEQQLSAGRDIILEIDWQGTLQVKQQIHGAVCIFILPPSCDALESRLADRGDDTAIIKRRMQGARSEISHYHEYDFLVINDVFETALQELKTIIQAMGNGYIQQKGYYDDFVRSLLNDGEN